MKPTLNSAYTLMLSDEYYTLEHYRCLGRVVHGIVHALGPELVPGSEIMKKCNLVNFELKVTKHFLKKKKVLNFGLFFSSDIGIL